MSEQRIQRRLAAILAADVVGYSRLMERDEAGTLASLKPAGKMCSNRWSPSIRAASSRRSAMVLVEFGSAVNAVACAAEMQQAMAATNACCRTTEAGGPDRRQSRRCDDRGGRSLWRRRERRGAAGRRSPSRRVCDFRQRVTQHVREPVDLDFVDAGEHAVKNIERPVHVWLVAGGKPTFVCCRLDGAGVCRRRGSCRAGPAVDRRASLRPT